VTYSPRAAFTVANHRVAVARANVRIARVIGLDLVRMAELLDEEEAASRERAEAARRLAVATEKTK
jgi:hypothetical protein